MTEPTSGATRERVQLTRDRVLAGAIAVADGGGISALTIRTLAQELGVKPMSVYHYVANKDEIIDSIVDLVFAEIELPLPHGEWQKEMRRRANSARRVLAGHRWATPLLQSRLNPGPATLRHHNAFIATLRAAGFSVKLTAHAFALIDSYVFGFALSENSLPIHGPDSVADTAGTMMQFFDAEAYPSLLEFTMEHVMRPDYDFGQEFGFGLELILDGLARSLHDDRGASAADHEDADDSSAQPRGSAKPGRQPLIETGPAALIETGR